MHSQEYTQLHNWIYDNNKRQGLEQYSPIPIVQTLIIFLESVWPGPGRTELQKAYIAAAVQLLEDITGGYHYMLHQHHLEAIIAHLKEHFFKETDIE